MKLKDEVLQAIMERPTIRLRLAEALGVTEQTIIKNIKVNHDNLTKASALAIIRTMLNLTDDEILDVEETESKNN